MNELELTEDQVRDEHLRAVNEPAHWLYLFGVLVGGMIVMLAVIALLGAAGG